MFRTDKNICLRTIPVVILLVVLLSSCGTGAFFYYPTKGETTTPAQSGIRYSEIKVPSTKGRLLNGWILHPDTEEPLGYILHFHGNAANISNQYRSVVPLVKAGYIAVVFDYQGYGLSEGKKPKQPFVLDDGLAMIDTVYAMANGQPIILFGQSLGGHLAVVAAAQKQDKLTGLVVEGAFTGHKEIAIKVAKGGFKLTPKWLVRMMVPSKYDAIDVVDQITIPKLFIHSTKDRICPYEMGQALHQKAVGSKDLWTVHGRHIATSQDMPEEFVAHFKALLAP